MFLGFDDHQWLVFVGMLFVPCVFFYWRLKEVDSARRPPTLPSFPIIGSLLTLPFLGKMHVWFLRNYTRSSVVGFHLGSMYTIILQTREVINEALLKKSIDFAGRPVRHCLLAINPQLRGIIDPPYYDARFKRYHRLSLTILRELGFGTRAMEDRIHAEARDLLAEVRATGGRTFDPHNVISGSVMNVVAGMLFGVGFDRSDRKLHAMTAHAHDYVRHAADTSPIDALPLLRFLPSLRARLAQAGAEHRRLLELIEERIDETLASADVDDDGRRRTSFVGRFRELEGPDYDRRELVYIVRDLCVAGTETCLTTLRWAVALLANHPEVQRRLHAEIDAAVPPPGEDGSGDRLPSLDDQPALPYVEATVLEVMRVRTIMPLSGPRRTTCDTDVAGYFIPAGTLVFTNLYAVHMNPEVWSDPSVFRPERFLNAEGELVDKDRVIPFSVGKRSCLGELLARQEVFLLLAALLQNFSIRPPDGQQSIVCREVAGITFAPLPYSVQMIPRVRQAL